MRFTSHAHTQFALDDLGDLRAPPGSASWTRAVKLELQSLLDEATSDLRAIRLYAKGIVEHKAYQQLDDEFGHPFVSMAAFARTKRPYGLGYDAELLEAIVQEDREGSLEEFMAEIHALQKHGTNQYTKNKDAVNTTSSPKRGTKGWQIARLKRDYVDIAEALARGEYPSVHAAAKAAGFVHDPTPLTMLHRYWRQVPPDERIRFLTEMLTPNERRALQFGFEDEELSP